MQSTQRRGLVRFLKRRFYHGLKTPQQVYTRSLTAFAVSGTTRILDIGCGYTAPALTNLTVSGLLKVGVDLVSDLRPTAAPGVRLVQADSGRLPFRNETFDLVICKSVVEHLNEPKAVFCEVFRVLTPGGHFFFLTPNRWDYISLIATLVPNRYHRYVVRSTTGRPEEDTFPTCYRANTTRQLRHMACTIGFEIEYMDTLRQHPHYLQFNPILYLVGIVYEQMVARTCRQLRPWILGLFRRPSLNRQYPLELIESRMSVLHGSR